MRTFSFIIHRSSFIVVLCLGCGQAGPERATVSGTVTLDGVPVAAGSINFIPTEGTTGPSAGGTIKDGQYHVAKVKGVIVGRNRVELRANKKTGKKVKDPMNPKALMDEIVEAFPPEYNTKSTVVKDIQSGSNEINFDVSSKPAVK
jgi:hypothetical protein